MPAVNRLPWRSESPAPTFSGNAGASFSLSMPDPFIPVTRSRNPRASKRDYSTRAKTAGTAGSGARVGLRFAEGLDFAPVSPAVGQRGGDVRLDSPREGVAARAEIRSPAEVPIIPNTSARHSSGTNRRPGRLMHPEARGQTRAAFGSGSDPVSPAIVVFVLEQGLHVARAVEDVEDFDSLFSLEGAIEDEVFLEAADREHADPGEAR